MAKQKGLEPDECYCLGEKKDFPDLAIEVIVSSSLLDKFDIYAGLGMQEVWAWQNSRFSIYALHSQSYEVIPTSELLPQCNLTLLSRFVQPDNQFEAVMAFREAIKS
jgi:Uma2 family endonuclease